MNLQKIKKNKGFVILFAVTISSILLAIALGVANIAYKELRFGTNARDTNDAFFAADTGAECALFYDRSDTNAFVTGSGSISCGGNSITVSQLPVSFWTFTVPGLGSTGQGCAKVTVDKTDSSTTKIISKGYNIGNASCTPSADRVERELDVSY